MVKETIEYESLMDFKEKVPDLADYMEMEQTAGSFDEKWKEHWWGMPEFEQEDDLPFKRIIVQFRNQEDYDSFAKILSGDQKLTEKTKSIWYPALQRDENTLKRWVEFDD